MAMDKIVKIKLVRRYHALFKTIRSRFTATDAPHG